jgi:hypothetical protein
MIMCLTLIEKSGNFARLMAADLDLDPFLGYHRLEIRLKKST